MRRQRVRVCAKQDLLTDQCTPYSVADGTVSFSLFIHSDKVYAVGDTCPHQNAPLADARIMDGQLVCRIHGYRFDINTGNCTTVGGYGIPVYQVDVEDNNVYVSYWDFDE